MKQKFSLSSLFENRIVMLIFSFILALIAWIVVAFIISPETTKVIRNVPVLINERDAAYKAFGLHVVDEVHQTVDVVVTGARLTVNSLTAESIKVTPMYSNVDQPGTFTLSLSASRSDPQQSFSIQPIRDTITLVFDAEAQQRFMVDTSIKGVSVGDGLMFGNTSVSPLEITVSGSEAEVKRISRVVASYYGYDDVLEQSIDTIAEIFLYDELGREISKENLKLSAEYVELIIPILKRGMMSLEIGFTNIPEGFDISTLNYILSDYEIPIAADPNVIETIGPKLVGEVDLAKFEIGEDYKFEITLPSHIRNLDGIDTLIVTFPKENLDSKRVRVTEFRLDNAPVNYDIEVLSKFINNVTVIGPSEELALLLDTSVVAVIDFNSVTFIEKGERDMIVRFRISGSKSLWVAGVYTVMVSVTPK